MDSAAAIFLAYAKNKDIWEMTEDENIDSLVDEQSIVLPWNQCTFIDSD